MQKIRHVVILGGGSSGWMTASYLRKALPNEVEITLLESPLVGKVGVGEATVPNLQKVFFDFLGLSEDEWMKNCNGAFKAAVKFVNWRRPVTQGGRDHFYHPFGLNPNCDNVPLSQYWWLKQQNGISEPVDYACYREPAVMDAKRAPRHHDGRSAVNYAWHMDANLIANFLADWSVERGVKRVLDHFVHATLDDRGFISSVTTKTGRVIEGDLFVDCSGFRGLLINETMKEPFIDMNDMLLCDSAVAAPVPHDDEKHGVEPYTTSIGMKHGWTWKTPMLGRFGSGYVYSSRFCDKDEAAREFSELWGLEKMGITPRHMKFRTGRNRRAWVKNCVSIGLSSCFVEPLESTGIYFISAAIYQLAKHFPDTSFDERLINSFNVEIETMFDDSRDFLQAHYFTATRRDTPFWAANGNELKLSDSMQEKIELYKAGLPVCMPFTDEASYYTNFETEFRNFWTNSSYYCIFSGMGFQPDRPMSKLLYQPEACQEADRAFAKIKRETQELVDTLPSHYEYLKSLHQVEEPVVAMV
jgi:tryptophan 6-halogenase